MDEILGSCRRPEQRQPRDDHDAVHDQAEGVWFETQYESPGDEGAEHQRRTRDQSFCHEIGIERTESLEGGAFKLNLVSETVTLVI